MDKRILRKVLSGLSDRNIRFSELRSLVSSLGFDERVKGDHHIFTHAGVAEILNLQPLRDGMAKAYQVKQARRLEMYKYEVIVYWSEEDRAYIAEVPELPGCMADGPTYEGALKSAQVAISEWIETARTLGREIPVPKGRLTYA
jgi:predicted RNase H-like HicB family nuclease